MLAVYRHDTHKLRKRSHDAAADEFAGVRVNEDVPRGADADAALLSRPRGEPEQTVANHASPYRLSLRTGDTVVEDRVGAGEMDAAVRELVSIADAEVAHRAWLQCDVAACFNESVYYPYTSVKYHVLLAAALLSNYRAGAGFDELSFVVDDPDAAVTPHRTVFHSDRVSLRVTCEPGDRPAAALGQAPARSFADTWSRVPRRPAGVDPDEHRQWRILDAQLRRIRAWSTALQFLEDSLAAVEAAGSMGGVGGAGDAE
ncbi:hypothetical protein DV733_09440 [Halapricum salinum]|uniref:DUF8168 domain-containing protein n=1 Tax=Halapricum salinum TaxID=1457250 RepID=A0A4D6HHZ0_9EURY|nr:hypothetical protein DV733_09440 [Halapricum salinum]